MYICCSTPKLIAKFTTGPRGLVLLMSTKRLLELLRFQIRIPPLVSSTFVTASP